MDCTFPNVFGFINYLLYTRIWVSWLEGKVSVTADSSDAQDLGEPLILTPYIEEGQIETARNLSLVQPAIGNVTSYAGYFTVNKTCGNNIFIWFFPAKNNWTTAPVLLWLQGGPGASSMFGLFKENGPFNHFSDGLLLRNYSWHNESNIIYMDQPVGAGFSYTENSCYATNLNDSTRELYSALEQFFQLFSELQKNKFFITGESYGGHYIPVLAVFIHNINLLANSTINLIGILIGNPLIKLTCHNYAEFLFEWAVIDDKRRKIMNESHAKMTLLAEDGQYGRAWEEWIYILNTLVKNNTKLPSNELMLEPPVDTSDYDQWIVTKKVRHSIHVGNTTYNDPSNVVYNNLKLTIAQSVTRELEQLLNWNYSIGLYSGNLDLICLYPSLECMLRSLQWWGLADYLNATRYPWYFNDTLCGWFKMAGPMYEVVVKDAGHSACSYQPACVYHIMNLATTTDLGINPASRFNTTSP